MTHFMTSDTDWLLKEAKAQKLRSDLVNRKLGLGAECDQSIESTQAMRLLRHVELLEGFCSLVGQEIDAPTQGNWEEFFSVVHEAYKDLRSKA